MIPSNLITLSTIAFSLLCAASPLAVEQPQDLKSLAARAKHHCKAVRKSGASFSEKRQFEFEDEEFEEAPMTLDERDEMEYHCNIQGHIVNPPQPTYQMSQITVRQCANWCLCRLGWKQCKSFGFTQTNAQTGVGTCSAYNVEAKDLTYNSGGGGTFYAHHCFKQSNPTRPHPPPMTTAHHKRSEATQVAKREDSFGDLVAHALEGL